MNISSNGTITAYPLTWPLGWKRTQYPQKALYDDKRTLALARDALTREVRLLGGKQLVISSNLELRQDGLPRSGQRQPVDKGVAVYFQYKGKPVAFACDKWNQIEDNLWGIKLGVDGMRQMERSGMSEMLDRAFKGFDALAAPAGSNWWEVLGVPSTATVDEIKTAFRNLARQHHPDSGGDAEKFIQVQQAYDAGLKAVGA